MSADSEFKCFIDSLKTLKVFFCRDGSLVKMTASIVNVHSQTQQAYRTTIWAEFFHSAPHVNITFHQVRTNNSEPIPIYWVGPPSPNKTETLEKIHIHILF